MCDDANQSGELDPLALSMGERVAALRQQRGWEMTELASRTGMSNKYIWRIENGLLAPGLRNLARLATAFEISLSSLLQNVAIPAGLTSNRAYVATLRPGRRTGKPAAKQPINPT